MWRACGCPQAKRGKTKFIIGKGNNMMDFTYVGNVAQAHLQVRARTRGGQRVAAGWGWPARTCTTVGGALARTRCRARAHAHTARKHDPLHAQPSHWTASITPRVRACVPPQAADAMTPTAVAGKAYFVTNQDPQPFWGMMGDVCGGLGYTRPHLRLPFLLILLVAAIFEYIIRPLLKPIKTINSDFTVNRCVWRQRCGCGGAAGGVHRAAGAVGRSQRVARKAAVCTSVAWLSTARSSRRASLPPPTAPAGSSLPPPTGPSSRAAPRVISGTSPAWT